MDTGHETVQGCVREAGAGVDPNDCLACQVPTLLDGIAQLLLKQELTVEEHQRLVNDGLPLDFCYQGFVKLAHALKLTI